jgi:hypothetical protein
MVAVRTTQWTWIWPVLAWAILSVTPFLGGGTVIAAAAGIALLGTVFAAVYHAEVIAHRVGEPFGRRGRVDRAWAAPRTGLERERSSSTGGDASSRRNHIGHWPDHGASGHRAFGYVRRLFVLCSGAVKYGRPSLRGNIR